MAIIAYKLLKFGGLSAIISEKAKGARRAPQIYNKVILEDNIEKTMKGEHKMNEVTIALLSVIIGGILGFAPTFYTSKKEDRKFILEKKILAYESAKKSMANYLIHFQTMDEDILQEEANETLSKMDLFATNKIKDKYTELFKKMYEKRKELENTIGFKDNFIKSFKNFEKDYEDLLQLMRKDIGVKIRYNKFRK